MTRTFSIFIQGAFYLENDHLWPDGDDMPAEPTAEDVAKILRSYGHMGQALSDWGMMPRVMVRSDDGRSEAVVWPIPDGVETPAPTWRKRRVPGA